MRLALVCFYCLCVFVYVLYFIATMSFAGYFLPVLFCMLSMLISDSRFDLVWFRLSCDHGWIRSGSVNVRKQQQQQQQQSVPIRYGKIGVLLHNLRAGIGIVASLAANTTDALGALEPLVLRFLADVAACGSTLLPGWSSIATTRTATTALTTTICPRSPPVLCLLPLTFRHFFPGGVHRFPASLQKQEKQCRTFSTISPVLRGRIGHVTPYAAGRW